MFAKEVGEWLDLCGLILFVCLYVQLVTVHTFCYCTCFYILTPISEWNLREHTRESLLQRNWEVGHTHPPTHTHIHTNTHSEHLRLVHDAKWVPKPSCSCMLHGFSIFIFKPKHFRLICTAQRDKVRACVFSVCTHMNAHMLPHFFMSQLVLWVYNKLTVLSLWKSHLLCCHLQR